MTKVGAAVVLAVMLLAGCSDKGGSGGTVGSSSALLTESSSGAPDVDLNPDIVNRIVTSTSCADLQVEFDNATVARDQSPAGSDDAKRSTAYMGLADERKRAIGCPG